MNRRRFLKFLAASLVADPERLLWVPGKKLISIPATNLSTGLSLDEINEITMRYISPKVLDVILRESPIFNRLSAYGNKYHASDGLKRSLLR